MEGAGTRKTARWKPCNHEGLTNEAIPTGQPLFPASLLAARLVWKWTKPSRLPTMAHASRVSRRPEGILSLAYGCYLAALRGRASYQLPVWTKPITDYGVRHEPSSTKACVGVGRFLLVRRHTEARRIVLETCHSHYPAPPTSHFAQPSKILGCYRAICQADEAPCCFSS